MKKPTPLSKKCVLEGARHDSVQQLQYYAAQLDIPENAHVLSIETHRLTLHARISDFSQPEYVLPLYVDRSKIKGWNLNRTEEEQYLSWAFEMPRALVVPDGRFYLNEVHYKPGFSYYLPSLPKIMCDSAKFFTGQISEEELLGLCRRLRD